MEKQRENEVTASEEPGKNLNLRTNISVDRGAKGAALLVYCKEKKGVFFYRFFFYTGFSLYVVFTFCLSTFDVRVRGGGHTQRQPRVAQTLATPLRTSITAQHKARNKAME